MTAHPNAEFFRDIADGGSLLCWEVAQENRVWVPVGPEHLIAIHHGKILLRRKPQISLERFNEWWERQHPNDYLAKSSTEALSHWCTWEEAWRQAKEAVCE
jgi:hypothetical protein